MTKRAARFLISATVPVLTLVGNAVACPPPPPPRYIEPPAPIEGEAPGDYALRVVAYNTEVVTAAQAEEAERVARITEWQTRWWDEADQVFVARVERARLVDPPRDLAGFFSSEVPEVRMAPQRWLKGESATRRFDLSVDGYTSCGPSMWPAVNGGAGALFIVYARAGAVRGTRQIIAMVDPAHIYDARVRQAYWETFTP